MICKGLYGSLMFGGSWGEYTGWRQRTVCIGAALCGWSGNIERKTEVWLSLEDSEPLEQ